MEINLKRFQKLMPVNSKSPPFTSPADFAILETSPGHGVSGMRCKNLARSGCETVIFTLFSFNDWKVGK